MNVQRQRPLAVGPLRAFESVARLLSFRAAADELHLTQPAISRQIRGLEDELGAQLFLRGTRHVELTGAGTQLLRSVAPLLTQLDGSVRQIRNSQRRQPVAVTTFASLASLWLLPRLQSFQNEHPESDIRISATDTLSDLDDPEIDLALRYCHPQDAPPGSTELFGEILTPVASPALMQRQPLRSPAALAEHTLLEEDDNRASTAYLSWRHWLRVNHQPKLEPRGWLYLNFTYQQIQAAIAGTGLALGRLPLVCETLARGELVEPFGAAGRVISPYGYWLVKFPARRERPALAAFEAWLLEQARQTREALAAPDMQPAARQNA